MTIDSAIETNHDPQELQKFGQQASHWWDPQGPMWTLHAINPIRSQYIDSFINVAERHLLDIGCGAGLLAESMAYRGAKVTGIDLNQQVLQVAAEHAQSNNLAIDYQLSSAESFADTNHSNQDVIVCMEMLEHVPDPKAIIQACARILKPGGYLFLSTINRRPKAFLQAIVAAEYLMNLIPKGTHEYDRLIKPSELAQWCRSADLDVLNMKGLTYNPISKNFRLSNSTDVNYFMVTQKPIPAAN